MKRSISILLAFFLLSAPIFGQPINKPITNSNSWKEFIAYDKSFKILFPKEQNKYKIKYYPQKQWTNYNYLSDKERYSISYKDFPAPMVNEIELKARLEQALSKYPTYEYISRNGLLGAETRTKNKYKGIVYDTLWRFFIVDQRLFEITIEFPLADKLSPDKRKFYQQKTDKFLNSFTVLNIPKAKYKPSPPLPTDYGIELNGQFFKSKTLGFTLQLPKNWKVVKIATAKDSKPTEKIGTKKSMLTRLDEMNNKIILTVRSKKENAFLGIGISRKAFVNETLNEAIQKGASKYGLIVQKQKIKRRNFLMVPYLGIWVGPNILTQKNYFTSRKGFVLTFVIAYHTVSDKTSLENSFNSLTFHD